MSEFSYLINKIVDAPFEEHPFRHVLVNDLFTEDHFRRVVESQQVRLPECHTAKELIDRLHEAGYEAIDFPGCITDLGEYIDFADRGKRFNKFKVKGYGRDVIEGYGVTFRLKSFKDDYLEELISFFNSPEFANAIAEKFGVIMDYTIETGLQKNLKHYEISPHPDTSRKALTYMVNIYTDPDASQKEMHTHFCRLIDQYSYLYDFWKHNDADPVWVPWDWATTEYRTNTNNSISIFRPSYDTMHAVRITADDMVHQRNQIYGNLWYSESQKKGNLSWQELDLPSHTNDNRLARVARKVLG